MTYNSLALLEELQAAVRTMILQATRLKGLPQNLLIQSPGAGKWSIAQVLEHLNAYGRYYLPAISHSLEHAQEAVPEFRPGWFGDYFTRIMKPGKDGRIGNKMSAPKAYRPQPQTAGFPVIETFLEQQQQLLLLLEKAKSKNIGSIRTPISISKLIRLKTGDTFRFLVAHEQRHFLQVEYTFRQLNPDGRESRY